MQYASCAISLTENCNARCEMCCDSRGYVKGNTLTEEDILLLLQRVNEYELITRIGITGGEPMLYPELVRVILEYDYTRKMTLSIKSNGFWGKDVSTINRFIASYKGKIHDISLSYDGFHKPYVGINCIRNIIDICYDNEIPTEVVGCFLNNSSTPGQILDELGHSAYKTAFHFQPVMKTGSARNFESDLFINKVNLNKHKAYCLGMLKPDILINASLNVFPCCSQVAQNTLLIFGNIREDGLSEITSRIKHNKLMHLLFVHGFAPYLAFLDRHDIFYPKQLTTPCELCEILFQHEEILESIKRDEIIGNL